MGDWDLKRQRCEHRREHIVAIAKNYKQIGFPIIKQIGKQPHSVAHVSGDARRSVITRRRFYARENLVPSLFNLLYRMTVFSRKVCASNDQPMIDFSLALHPI
jgi:hypothetical protein